MGGVGGETEGGGGVVGIRLGSGTDEVEMGG